MQKGLIFGWILIIKMRQGTAKKRKEKKEERRKKKENYNIQI